MRDDADIVPIIKKQLKMRRDALADFRGRLEDRLVRWL